MSLYNKLLSHTTKNNYTDINTCYDIGVGRKQSYVERLMRKIVEETEKRPHWGYCIKPQFDEDQRYIIGYYRELKNKFDL